MSENATKKTLTPAQRRCIEALLTAPSATEAAKMVGIHRRTLYRWLRDPVFVAALREAEGEAVATLSRTLAGLGEDAAAALRDALKPGQKMSIRLRASEVVIGNLLRIRELVDLENRLTKLEAQANENN